MTVKLGTRASPLALWQANHVADRLRAETAAAVELVHVETTGDRIRDRPLSQIGGDGLFTREVQWAVLDGRADVAVHSLKDLPTIPVERMTLASVPARGPVGDVFVSTKHAGFEHLPRGARVGTSSLRRRSQILHRRPDLVVENLRGNVETRLRKLTDEGFDAIILAEAGLVRLGLAGHITEILDRGWMLPAVGQGALGLECRSDDEGTLALLATLTDAATSAAVRAERAFLAGLGGGCLVPIGAFATVDAGRISLRGCVLPPDGARRIDGTIEGDAADAEGLGRAMAEELLGRGARELLPRAG